MAAVTICGDFGAQENKVSHCFPIYLAILKSFPLCKFVGVAVAKFQRLRFAQRIVFL